MISKAKLSDLWSIRAVSLGIKILSSIVDGSAQVS